MGGVKMKQRYDSYKPSGIGWIGEIPSHWNILPLKRISVMFGRIGYRGYTVQDLTEEGNGAITLSPSNMVDGRMDYSNVSYLSWYKYHESPEIKIQQGDILYVKTGSTFGKTSYVDELPMEATINPQILRIVPSIHPKYLAYCMSTPYSQALTDCYVVGSTIPTISQESIGNFSFAIPPLAEQEAIAAWIDEKCGGIDATIAKVNREIELIDELKQSEISRVVTRGLNPDAPLHPSGIDWIGDVPSHWEICRLKHKANITLGKMLMSQPPKDQEFLYTKEKYLKSRNIGWLELYLDDVDEMWFNKSEKEMYELHENDIIINEGGDIGKVTLWKSSEQPYFIQNSVHKVSLDEGIPKFIMYWIFSLSKRNYFWSIVSQVSIAHLTKEKLSNAPIVFPPLPEQQSIADYLDKKCAEIDGLKAKLVKKRETLKELRQAIISEVVTGKRKVV